MGFFDVLRSFRKTQPTGKEVSVREFVKAQTDLEQSIDSILRLLRGGRGFSARRDANAQAFVDSDVTVCTFDVEERDDFNEFNPTTGIFTARGAGWRHFTATITAAGFDAGEPTGLLLTVTRGSQVIERWGGDHQSGAADENSSAHIAASIHLLDGDLVTLSFYHEEGASASQVLASGFNWFAGVIV